MCKDLKRSLITHLLRFDWGKNQIARFVTPLTFVISAFTLLKVYQVSITWEHMIYLSVAAIAGMYFIGLIWDKLGLVEEEIEYSNERNRFVKAELGKNWLKRLNKK